MISRCPKCRSLKPTLAHFLWTCPQIEAFWIQIDAYINRVKRINTIRDPLLYLFGITSDPSSRKGVPSNQISRWIYVCLIMAKRCILKCWIYKHPPTMTNLVMELKHLFILERRDAELSSSKRNSAFFNCWEDYILFTFKSTDIQELTNTLSYGH